MKSICMLSILFLSICACSQDAWTDKTRALPDDLRKVPVALYIMHGPNPNFPELNTTGERPESKYVWKHSTSAISPNQDLQVLKAGSFIWYNEEGWKRNVELNRKQFAERFSCPKGLLKKGIQYTFEKNYRWGSNLYGGDALWYILAEDEDGNLVKGMALLETESELIKPKH